MEAEAVIRIVRRTLLIAAALLILAAAGVGWYYSNQILGPDSHPERRGQTVLAHTDSTITLAVTPKAPRPGREPRRSAAPASGIPRPRTDVPRHQLPERRRSAASRERVSHGLDRVAGPGGRGALRSGTRRARSRGGGLQHGRRHRRRFS